MEKQNYHSSITVNVTPGKAFEAISHVSAWWAKSFEGNSTKPDDIFTVRFEETFATFKIEEVIEGKKIVWLVTDCYLHWLTDKQEWKGTKIEWEVSTSNNATLIDFTHVGLVPEIECYNDCVKGWNFFIKDSLFKLITDGKGTPEVPKNSRDGNNG